MLNSCASDLRQTSNEDSPDAHHGNDIKGKTGDKVMAIKDGTVTFADNHGSYGKVVIITHDDFISMYAHMDNINVKEGQIVKQKDKIGEVGATGRADGPHLHLEIRNLDNKKNVETSVKFLRNFNNLTFNGDRAEVEYNKIIEWYDNGKPGNPPKTGSKADQKIADYDPITGTYPVVNKIGRRIDTLDGDGNPRSDSLIFNIKNTNLEITNDDTETADIYVSVYDDAFPPLFKIKLMDFKLVNGTGGTDGHELRKQYTVERKTRTYTYEFGENGDEIFLYVKQTAGEGIDQAMTLGYHMDSQGDLMLEIETSTP